MEKIVEQGLLYDIYGSLLTEHQQKLYEAAVYDDLSLSEMSEEFGISRQGVHDLLKRCDKILKDYEEKLNLMEKFSLIRQNALKIKNASSKVDGTTLFEISGLVDKIIETI